MKNQKNLNISQLYLAIGNGSIEIIDAIKEFNKLSKNNKMDKSSAIIDKRDNCVDYINDIITRIKKSTTYINNSIEISKENNPAKYFEITLGDGHRVNEELLKISFKILENKKEKMVIKFIRKIELPDNYNEIFLKYIKTSEEFKIVIMDYLLNVRELEVFKTGIIQFPHPGGEHIVNKPFAKVDGENVSYSEILKSKLNFKDKYYNKDKIMLWNDAPMHRRKYICNNGKYVSYDNEGRSILSDKTKVVFWGEWEPQSKIIKINELKSSKPTYMHEPLISKETGQQKISSLQNTDPYVFGKSELDTSFYYCCCKQITGKGEKTAMQELKIGNIILFGSYKDDEEFWLDTVFVVADEGQPYSQYGNEKLKNISDVYKFVSIDKVREGNKNSLASDDKGKESEGSSVTNNIKTGCISSGGFTFTLYKSASYNSQVNDCFSFFPCKVFNEKDNNFYPRVTLKLGKFGLCNANQGCPRRTNGGKTNPEQENLYIAQHFIKNYAKGMYKLPIEISNELDVCIEKLKNGEVVENLANIINKSYWNVLVTEVLNQGYYLGVYAEESKF